MDQVDLNVNFDTTVSAKLGPAFWRGILDFTDYDFGYLQYSMYGRLGKTQRTLAGRRWRTDMNYGKENKRHIGAFGGHRTLLVLSCGTLEIFKLYDKDCSIPFKCDPRYSIDIAGDNVHHRTATDLPVLLDEPSQPGLACFRLFGDAWEDKSDQSWAFCGDAHHIPKLQEAWNLQIQRFDGVSGALRTADKIQKAYDKHDGSWFKDYDFRQAETYPPMVYPPTFKRSLIPKDTPKWKRDWIAKTQTVISPKEQWAEAMEKGRADKHR